MSKVDAIVREIGEQPVLAFKTIYGEGVQKAEP